MHYHKNKCAVGQTSRVVLVKPKQWKQQRCVVAAQGVGVFSVESDS